MHSFYNFLTGQEETLLSTCHENMFKNNALRIFPNEIHGENFDQMSNEDTFMADWIEAKCKIDDTFC